MHKYKFIINPVSGGGRAKALFPVVENIFKSRKAVYDIYTTRAPLDAVDAAADAVRNGFDIIVAVGGDGTVNEVLNGMAGTGTVLAVLQGGKGNDFASAMGIPRNPVAACEVLLKASVRSIDLGRVLGRYFINTVGVGFDAAVAQKVNRGSGIFKGTSAYVYQFLKTLRSYQPVEMEIDLGEGPFIATPLLVAVGIGQAYGGGMKILPDAVPDDGLFDVCIMDTMSSSKLIYHFPKVFKGALKNIKQAGMHRTRELKLNLCEERPLHLEGEILKGSRLHFTLEQKAIKVLTGPGVIGT